MASYQEIRALFTNSDLMEKVQVAVVIAAGNMAGGTPTTAQKAWIAEVFSNPSGEAKKALMAVLSANSAATVAQITGATDAAIQTNVDGIVQILVDAKVGA